MNWKSRIRECRVYRKIFFLYTLQRVYCRVCLGLGHGLAR